MDTYLGGIYILQFGQISVKFSVFRSYTLIVAPVRMKFGNMLPLWSEKPENCPLSNLYTGALHCAQCCR